MPKATNRSGATKRPDKTKPATGDSSRQAELVQIAATLFAEHGYAATTVRDIADAAGILSGSLYHHFSSKEDIVDGILTGFLDPMLTRYEEIVAADLGPKETIEQLVVVSLAAMDEQRTAIVVYQNEASFLSGTPRFAYLDDAARRFREMWVTAIERGVAEGVLRPEINAQLVYRFVRDAVWATARWYRPDGDVSTDELTDQYLGVILDGIAAPAGRGKRAAR